MSPEFEKIISWAGSPQATCACGRVHYTANGDFMEPGELDGLNAKQKLEPNRYFPDEQSDAVSVGTFFGVPYVWNCPCDRLTRFEDFLWSNRRALLTYFETRIDREQKQAIADMAAFAAIPKDKLNL